MSFWNRHQGKISLSIFGLFLAAIIITGIVMTFGLPVVMGVLGGALFFGLAAAAVGVVVTMVGGLVGAKFDTDYLLPFTLGSIKTESKGKLVEREVLGGGASVKGVPAPDVEHNEILTNSPKKTGGKTKLVSPFLDTPSGEEDDDDVSTEEEGDTTVKDSKESSSVDSATDSDGEDNDENIDEKKDTQKNFKEDSPKDSSASDSDSGKEKTTGKSSGSGTSEEITVYEEDADNPRNTGINPLSASTPPVGPAGGSSEASNYPPPLFQKHKGSSAVEGEGITTIPTPRPGQTKGSGED